MDVAAGSEIKLEQKGVALASSKRSTISPPPPTVLIRGSIGEGHTDSMRPEARSRDRESFILPYIGYDNNDERNASRGKS
jgi:hypothetical protein